MMGRDSTRPTRMPPTPQAWVRPSAGRWPRLTAVATVRAALPSPATRPAGARSSHSRCPEPPPSTVSAALALHAIDVVAAGATRQLFRHQAVHVRGKAREGQVEALGELQEV